MTSEEIKAIPDLEAYATEAQILDRAASWLQEIAYQLAVVNERNKPQSWEDALATADAVAAALRGH